MGVVPKSVTAERIAENGGEETWAAAEALGRFLLRAETDAQAGQTLGGRVPLAVSLEKEKKTSAAAAAVVEDVDEVMEALTRMDCLDDDTHYCWNPNVVS